jgi:hypothetical protein
MMLQEIEHDEMQIKTIKSNAYARYLQDRCIETCKEHIDSDVRYQRMLGELSKQDFLTALTNGTVEQAHLQLVMLLISYHLVADDDVFYLFLQKQKIGAELHIYLEEGTYHKRLFRGPNTNDMKK